MTQEGVAGSQKSKENGRMNPRKAISYMELKQETDRSLAIVGLAWIEDLLESCLALHLRQSTSGEQDTDAMTTKVIGEMFQPEGPLGSFSAKWKMAYLLHIIGPITFRDLKIINDIRREFAHYVKAENPQRKIETLSFRSNAIADKTRNLKSKTSRRVLVKGRPNDSNAARAFLSAVDAIATGLKSYLVAQEEFLAETEGSEMPAPLP